MIIACRIKRCCTFYKVKLTSCKPEERSVTSDRSKAAHQRDKPEERSVTSDRSKAVHQRDKPKERSGKSDTSKAVHQRDMRVGDNLQSTSVRSTSIEFHRTTIPNAPR